MTIFEQVKLLYDSGLHSNVVSLVNLVLSIGEHSQPELLNSPAKFQILIYYADSLFHNKDYRKAENIYKKALQLKKTLSKTKGKIQGVPQIDMSSDIEIKYQIHLCNLHLKQYTQAMTVLESIAFKQRTPIVNMALAKLYHQRGMERSATTGYKEVLKECPLALEAAQGLLSLGVKGAEVASLMMNGTSSITNVEWLTCWIKAQAHLHSNEFTQAVTVLKQLDAKATQRDNVDILVSLGEAYHYNGEHGNALTILQRAHSLDPMNLKGMDILSSILAKEKKIKDLESLSSQLMTISEQAPEPWIAIAHYSFATKKNNRAVYFSQKALILSPSNQEGLLLKGSILLEMKKVQEAVIHFREVLRVASFRYEAHKGLVDCYIALHRTRDAISFASNACKQLGQSPRSLCLYASVLAKDPLTIDKAKTLLEKALKIDQTNLHAVYQLAEIYDQEKQYDKGIELLQKQIGIQSTGRLHQMLADFLSRSNDTEKAFDHYTKAVTLDPTNSRALEGLQRIEQHPDSIDNTYDIDVDDMADSDNEGELEESEVEAVWSDVDFP